MCEDCGKKTADVLKMGRQWCNYCWEVFSEDYQQWLDSSNVEDTYE